MFKLKLFTDMLYNSLTAGFLTWIQFWGTPVYDHVGF